MRDCKRDCKRQTTHSCRRASANVITARRNLSSEEDAGKRNIAEEEPESSEYCPGMIHCRAGAAFTLTEAVSLSRLSSPTMTHTTMSDTDEQLPLSPRILYSPTETKSTMSDIDNQPCYIDDQPSYIELPEKPMTLPQSDSDCPPELNCSVLITIPQDDRGIKDGAIFLGICGSQTRNGNGKVLALFRLEPEPPESPDARARIVFTTRAAAAELVFNTKPLFIAGTIARAIWDTEKYPPASRLEREYYSRVVQLNKDEGTFDLAAIEGVLHAIPDVGFFEIREYFDKEFEENAVDISFSSIAQARAAFKHLNTYLLENRLDRTSYLTYGLDPCDCVQLPDPTHYPRFWFPPTPHIGEDMDIFNGTAGKLEWI